MTYLDLDSKLTSQITMTPVETVVLAFVTNISCKLVFQPIGSKHLIFLYIAGVYHTTSSPDFYVDIASVDTLIGDRVTRDGLIIGANKTLTETLSLFERTSKISNFSYLLKVFNHIKLVAHVAVRNVSINNSKRNKSVCSS